MIATVSIIDWSVLVLSVVLVAIAGAWFARRQNSTEQYFVGGRNIPGWAAGLSLFATVISTITFIAYPGAGFGGDWTRLLPGLMLPIVIAFIAVAILPFYRRFIRMSAYEYLEQRFGYPARAYAAFLFLMLNLFRLSFVLFLSAKAIHTFTDWDIQRVILISGAITIAYTAVGGFEAVIWTDVVQSLILLGGGILCAAILLFAPTGGPVEALSTAYHAGKFRLADFSLDLTRPSVVVMVSYGLLTYLGLYITSQDSVQRYLATPSTRKARRGLWLGAICCVATWTLFMFIGSLLYSYYTLNPGKLPAHIAQDETKVFPHFVMTQLPRGVIGLILAAMIAASMSTLSSVINSMSLVTVCDFYGRIVRHRSDRQRLIAGKLSALIWGIIGTAAALSMERVQRALDFNYLLSAILSGGLMGVFMLAFLVRRAGAVSIYAGLAAGALVTAWGTFDQLAKLGLALPAWLASIRYPYHEFTLIIASNGASFGVGLLACLIWPNRRESAASRLTLWDLRSDDVQGEDLPGSEREGGAFPVASNLRE